MKRITLSLLLLPLAFNGICILPASKGQLTVVDFIKNQVATHHSSFKGIKGNFDSFKKYKKTLDTTDILTIPYLLDYIKTCIPASDTLYSDSVFVCFRNMFNTILKNLSNSLVTDYPNAMANFDKNMKAPDITALNDNLSQCGIVITMSEDGDDPAEAPGYIYNNFQDRVTTGVKEFFRLRAPELKQGVIEDGGLTISYEALYQKTKIWEQYLDKYPSCICTKEATALYKTYLETLLAGIDNTPVFDRDTKVLVPEVKTLYSKISKETNQDKTAKVVSEYYAMLATHNYVGSDDVVTKFLANHHLQ